MKLKFVRQEFLFNEYEYYSVGGKENLGTIFYYKEWKEFVWQQRDKTIMSEKCQEQVLNFTKELNLKYKCKAK